MKDYLESVYNVQIAFVRSWVVQKKTQKKRVNNRIGPTYRPASGKKMLVHMMEPFTWPEEPEDFEPYVFSWGRSCPHIILQIFTPTLSIPY
jgi:large subunit ribosomal protein L23